MAGDNGGLMGLCLQLFSIFCGSGKDSNQQQQQQSQTQQHQNYPQQQQPSWGTSPGQQAGQQQQQQYPPQQHQQPHQQQHQQPHGGKPPAPGPGDKPPAGYTTPGGHFDDNKYYGSDPQYQSWRNDARGEGDLAHKCFADSQNAYKSGDGARAKQLSEQGKQHQAKQETLNRQAMEWIFEKNNLDQDSHEVDLHGLYVKEAIEMTDRAIGRAQQRGIPELHVIVGKGSHSQGHKAKIKPAIEELMQKYNLAAQVDPKNAGVLIVYLNGAPAGHGTRDAGFVDQMGGRDNQDCVIM